MTIHQKVPIPLVNRGARVKRGFSGYPNAIHNPNGIQIGSGALAQATLVQWVTGQTSLIGRARMRVTPSRCGLFANDFAFLHNCFLFNCRKKSAYKNWHYIFFAQILSNGTII